jgi:hypothetical protein
MVNYHDSSGGHSDLWDYIDGNASRLSEAEERIAKLEARIRELEERFAALMAPHWPQTRKD